MKILVTSFCLVFCFFIQPEKEVEKIIPEIIYCHPADQFSYFANDPDFWQAHYQPEKIPDYIHGGKTITYPTPDGATANAFTVQGREASTKYLFVIHEWWGLNDHIKKECENYFHALKGVTVIALDLYDGKVATDRESASAYMQGTTVERAEAIIQGAYDYVGKDASVATIGWCFGGGWSLQASMLGKEQAKACIIYYGMPESDLDKLGSLQAEVLGIFASQEQWITPAIVDQFEKNLSSLDKKATIKRYDADHAFANPSRPAYKKEYAHEAFSLSVKLIQEKL